MASSNIYTSSLRRDKLKKDKSLESCGGPVFTQLSKVKTAAMCQNANNHLLFCHEKDGYMAGMCSVASYRKQGNQDMYTEENVIRRKKLQEDKQIQASIYRFWEIFENVRQGRGFIERREFTDAYIKFYKALVAPSEFSVGEARQIVEKDWVRDVGESEYMSKVLFFHSLFEVADIWTVGIGADLYVSFLSKLFDRVTTTAFDQERSLWVTVYAELDKIKSFVESKSVSDLNQQDEATEVKSTQLIRRRTPTEGLSTFSRNLALSKRLPEIANDAIKVFLVSKLKGKETGMLSAFENRVSLSEGENVSPTRTSHSNNLNLDEKLQRNMLTKSDVTTFRRSSISNREDDREITEESPTKLSLSQPVRLSMPSIYLSPDLSNAIIDKHSRPRFRDGAKFIQNLKRIQS